MEHNREVCNLFDIELTACDVVHIDICLFIELFVLLFAH